MTNSKKQTQPAVPGIEQAPEILNRYKAGGTLTPEEEKAIGMPAIFSGKSHAEVTDIQQKVLAHFTKHHGMEHFNSGEHELLSSGITMYNADGSQFTSSDNNFTIGSNAVSYSNMVALAGDYFAGSSQSNIANTISQAAPQDQVNVFMDKFNSMVSQTCVSGGIPNPVPTLLQIFNMQIQSAQNAKTQYGSNSSWLAFQEPLPFTIPLSQIPNLGLSDVEIDSMSMESVCDYILFPGTVGLGYWLIAACNMDHFGTNAATAYTVAHTVACQLAATAQTSGNAQATLMQAYMMNAYADHFMTDMFAPGHLRTPRVALHNIVPYYGDRLAQMMHGEDNIMGLNLTRSYDGATWVGYGDTRGMDDVNATNMSYANAAVALSIGEVYAAYQSQSNAAPPCIALQYAPDPVTVTNDSSNHPAMFIMNGSQLMNRDQLSVPTCSTYNDVTTLSAIGLYSNNDSNPPYMFSYGTPVSIPASVCKDGGVALAVFNNVLYAAWLDDGVLDNNSYQLACSSDGINWTTLPTPFTNGANGDSRETPPALCAFNGQLYLAWTDDDENGIMISTTSDPTASNNWSNQFTIPGSNPAKYGGPALTVYNDMLFAAWCSHSDQSDDHQIWVNSMDSAGNWGEVLNIMGNGATDELGPGLCGYDDNLYVSWLGYDNNGVYYTTSPNGVGWVYDQSSIPGSVGTDTKYGNPCFTTYNDELYAFWLVDDDQPMFSRLAIMEGSSDSNGDPVATGYWITPQQITSVNIDELPMAACEFGEYLAVAWVDDGSDNVMVQLWTPVAAAN